ncbi:MAG: aldolase, partial [Lentisphaerae bacterium]|nr:aldolase [Lentisphaerota bacterium]
LSVEIAGINGFDFLWICNEHVPNDYLGLERQILAARAHGMDS